MYAPPPPELCCGALADAQKIGGSLAKLIYYSRESLARDGGGRFIFKNFETDQIDDCVAFMSNLQAKQQSLNGSKPGDLCVMATGGGAYKFYDKIKDALGVEVIQEDEMECLIIGTALVLPSGRVIAKPVQDSISSSRNSRARSLLTAKRIPCNLSRRGQTSTPIS